MIIEYVLQDVKTKEYYESPYRGECGFSTDIEEAKRFPDKENFVNYEWEYEAFDGRIMKVVEIVSFVTTVKVEV